MLIWFILGISTYAAFAWLTLACLFPPKSAEDQARDDAAQAEWLRGYSQRQNARLRRDPQASRVASAALNKAGL